MSESPNKCKHIPAFHNCPELAEARADRDLLRRALQEIYDSAQFEQMNCLKCGDSEPMKDCDYVGIAKDALISVPAQGKATT